MPSLREAMGMYKHAFPEEIKEQENQGEIPVYRLGPSAPVPGAQPVPNSPARATMETSDLPGPPPPPEKLKEFIRPDYSRRAEFEEHVFKEIGGNPYLLDPYEEVKKADDQMPDIFNYVFQGQVNWLDRDKLDKNQQAHWENVQKVVRAHVYQEAAAKKKTLAERHRWMMGNFDDSAKRYYAALEKYGSKVKSFADAKEKQRMAVEEEKEKLKKDRGIAQKRISEIHEKMAKLDSGQDITAEMIKNDPQVETIGAGKIIDPKLKERIMNQFESEINYLRKTYGLAEEEKPGGEKGKSSVVVPGDYSSTIDQSEKKPPTEEMQKEFQALVTKAMKEKLPTEEVMRQMTKKYPDVDFYRKPQVNQKGQVGGAEPEKKTGGAGKQTALKPEDEKAIKENLTVKEAATELWRQMKEHKQENKQFMVEQFGKEFEYANVRPLSWEEFKKKVKDAATEANIAAEFINEKATFWGAAKRFYDAVSKVKIPGTAKYRKEGKK